jgi:glycosyltransferase involved in cell wall biosynthesis
MASYINLIPNYLQPKKVISIHDICSVKYLRIFRIERRFFTRIRWFINWVLMRNWEIKMLRKFDDCVAVSSLDREYLQSACPELKLSVVENGVDVEFYRPLPMNLQKKNVLFLGNMSYEPNSDGSLYFCLKLLPLIKKQIPQCTFFIVGKNPSEAILNLSDGENVIVTGYVDDPMPYYRRCDICVVPLRAGGGSRLKILEAMAVGRPVVSTSIGCEGLDAKNDQHILIADNPEEFAKKTIQLLTDEALYNRLVQQGRGLVEEKYSWDRISDKLLKVYSDLGCES